MSKTILITGSTDGIGLATAKSLAQLGCTLLLHGRNSNKLAAVKAELLSFNVEVETYTADLSILSEVEKLAAEVLARHQKIDVLINNAGVFVVRETLTADGLDVRFAVNTIAPYLLIKRLLFVFDKSSRIVNLSSAAQTSLKPDDLKQHRHSSDGMIYAQSKLALTMWSKHLASLLGDKGPSVIAVNPGSFLGSKMVKEAYGKNGGDIQIGADILVRAALSEDFAKASGLYFDNDAGQFALPHPDATDTKQTAQITAAIEEILASHGHS